jgi:hypothetical protein
VLKGAADTAVAGVILDGLSLLLSLLFSLSLLLSSLCCSFGCGSGIIDVAVVDFPVCRG